MNTLMLSAVALPQGLSGLLIGFLMIVIVLAILWGLIYCVETWISPLPPPVKMVLAIVIVVLVLIWAINAVGGAG